MKKKVIKMKPKLSKDLYSSEEMERYLGALSERQDDKIDTLVEGFDTLNRKIDNHTEMIGSLMEDVSVLKTDVSILKTDVSILKTDVSVLKDDMQIVKEDISVIKSDIKKRVDYDEFLALTRRVQKIEAKI